VLVEDDAAIRSSLTRGLRDLGHVVMPVGTGVEGADSTAKPSGTLGEQRWLARRSRSASSLIDRDPTPMPHDPTLTRPSDSP
jgi:CheY-like chemotaxis protein